MVRVSIPRPNSLIILHHRSGNDTIGGSPDVSYEATFIAIKVGRRGSLFRLKDTPTIITFVGWDGLSPFQRTRSRFELPIVSRNFVVVFDHYGRSGGDGDDLSEMILER